MWDLGNIQWPIALLRFSRQSESRAALGKSHVGGGHDAWAPRMEMQRVDEGPPACGCARGCLPDMRWGMRPAPDPRTREV